MQIVVYTKEAIHCKGRVIIEGLVIKVENENFSNLGSEIWEKIRKITTEYHIISESGDSVNED